MLIILSKNTQYMAVVQDSPRHPTHSPRRKLRLTDKGLSLSSRSRDERVPPFEKGGRGIQRPKLAPSARFPLYPLPSPPPSTAGFAQPAGFAGGEACSIRRPHQRTPHPLAPATGGNSPPACTSPRIRAAPPRPLRASHPDAPAPRPLILPDQPDCPARTTARTRHRESTPPSPPSGWQ